MVGEKERILISLYRSSFAFEECQIRELGWGGVKKGFIFGLWIIFQ